MVGDVAGGAHEAFARLADRRPQDAEEQPEDHHHGRRALGRGARRAQRRLGVGQDADVADREGLLLLDLLRLAQGGLVQLRQGRGFLLQGVQLDHVGGLGVVAPGGLVKAGLQGIDPRLGHGQGAARLLLLGLKIDEQSLGGRAQRLAQAEGLRALRPRVGGHPLQPGAQVVVVVDPRRQRVRDLAADGEVVAGHQPLDAAGHGLVVGVEDRLRPGQVADRRGQAGVQLAHRLAGQQTAPDRTDQPVFGAELLGLRRGGLGLEAQLVEAAAHPGGGLAHGIGVGRQHVLDIGVGIGIGDPGGGFGVIGGIGDGDRGAAALAVDREFRLQGPGGSQPLGVDRRLAGGGGGPRGSRPRAGGGRRCRGLRLRAKRGQEAVELMAQPADRLQHGPHGLADHLRKARGRRLHEGRVGLQSGAVEHVEGELVGHHHDSRILDHVVGQYRAVDAADLADGAVHVAVQHQAGIAGIGVGRGLGINHAERAHQHRRQQDGGALPAQGDHQPAQVHGLDLRGGRQPVGIGRIIGLEGAGHQYSSRRSGRLAT